MAGLDGAAINKDGRDIHTANADHGAGHVFVAAADREHTIHKLRLA
jgi:hypothetical protein